MVGTLDTGTYANGPLTIGYQARNAARVVSAPAQMLRVDNTPVGLALSPVNDPDPNVWVNHAVTIRAIASAGPSGVTGTNCTTNGGSHYAYPAGGVSVNRTGVWTVACSSQNNAYDVSGHPASSAVQTLTIHIDETPPKIVFEPLNPIDPQAVVVEATDRQSGVARGQIEMRPAAGGSWQTLATQLIGTRLLAWFDDAALAPGKWVIQATSCDHAGNCASTEETLSLPLRIGSVLSLGFAKRGATRDCSPHHRSVRKRHVRRKDCQKGDPVLTNLEQVAFGRRANLQGRLTSAQGVPITNAAIRVLTSPDDGMSQYVQIASARTNSHGAWMATLPAGPSRLILATYGGSSRIQPTEGWATLRVPASVRVIRVWPRHVPWGGKVHIEAQLKGGYLPPGGALVRLRLGYGHAKITYGVKEHVGGNGTFEVTNAFGPGPAGVVRRYWLQECTLPEGDYPFAPACGRRNAIVVGGRVR